MGKRPELASQRRTRPPYIGERIHVIAGSQGNGYYAENGDAISGMEGPYDGWVLWDRPFTGWGTLAPAQAAAAELPTRMVIDPHELRRGDLVLYVTTVAEDEKGRPIVVIDIERPPVND